MSSYTACFFFFFFNDTATTEIYTLSLHDALPILPDLTFFFKADLEVSLQRILDGRPQLKYFEAGMDLRLSTDPYESFRIFQGRMLEQYLAMSTEFDFLVLNANLLVEAQQATIRELLTQRLSLGSFRRAERLAPKPAPEPARKTRLEVAIE